MADTVQNSSFWLPSHFLPDDDDLLSDDLPTRRHLPDPFSSLHNPIKDDDDDDDEELLAELTRYLTRSSFNHTEKGWGYSTSPQSTLTGWGPWSDRSGYSSNGSPTGPSRNPSPPLTTAAKNDISWELLYQAAAQVARLKLNSSAATTTTNLKLPRHHLSSSLHPHPQVRSQGSSVWRGERSDYYSAANHHNNHHRPHQQQHRSSSGGVPTWGPQRGNQQHAHVYTQGMTAVVLGGSGSGSGPGRVGLSKQSSGTGVFIPRRVDSGAHHNQPEISSTNIRKKSSGCSSTVLLPDKVVQALNLNVDDMKNGGGNYNNTPKRVLTHHEILMARRNALMSMQRRNETTTKVVGHHEIGLPTEWSY